MLQAADASLPPWSTSGSALSAGAGVNEALFGSVAATGFVIAFLHAAIPTHWLPFVLVGRAQGWSGRKTLGVAMLAGGGHVASTVLLGLLLTAAGMALHERFGPLLARTAGVLLIVAGVYYLFFRAPKGPGSVGPAGRTFRSDRAAVLALVTVLTLSPCESFLPVYLSGVGFGWTGFLLLTGVLAGATLVAMLAFTSLSMLGVARLRLTLLERYENLLLGGALSLLGIVVIVLET